MPLVLSLSSVCLVSIDCSAGRVALTSASSHPHVTARIAAAAPLMDHGPHQLSGVVKGSPPAINAAPRSLLTSTQRALLTIQALGMRVLVPASKHDASANG
eukprot:80328-Prorocentrum_minimum.AAC.2